MRPQLSQLINKLDPGLVPDGFRERLSNAYQDNLCYQISYAAEFLQVRQMLEEAGIMAVPFKGFWLAHEMYGNLADREASDVDMFVDIKDLERIRTLMTGAWIQG